MNISKLIFLISFIFNMSFQIKGEEKIMRLTSKSFKNGEEIPKKFTCEGENVSPELRWDNVPLSAKSLTLICDDPNAPTPEPWVHWIIFNIPPSASGLHENQDIKAISGARAGKGTENSKKYQGPCPPHGHGVHKYFFKLYALDKSLEQLEEGISKKDLLKAMNGHIIEEADLIGKYERK